MIAETIKSILNSILEDERIETIITSETKKQIEIWINELVSYIAELEKNGYLEIEWLSDLAIEIIKSINEAVTSKI
ncbi:MAG: hypothetical protein E7Z75_10150 [Methanobrevibacter olleyae]|uniref:Uncharacterized protein n=1 Tax=Methanobrevibacter olleyae TaxID=294671 RepID=A0A8T3VQ75_METOL|nr:hypothetical protein [Methanobrevibacter olleyae]